MYKKILGTLDGSSLSECSLEHIKTIATGCKVADVVLLTVVEEQPIVFGGEIASREVVEEISKQRQKEAKETQKRAEDYLAKVAGSLRKENIAVKTIVIQPPIGHGVADAILDYVQNNKVDLIIMSTHGRSGASRWAFGSVTDKVATHAKVPVLTITAAGCRLS